MLSGLVARGLSIGAWASHIVVTTSDAAGGGRALYGLPTVLGSIDFHAADEPDADEWRRQASAAVEWARALAEDAPKPCGMHASTCVERRQFLDARIGTALNQHR